MNQNRDWLSPEDMRAQARMLAARADRAHRAGNGFLNRGLVAASYAKWGEATRLRQDVDDLFEAASALEKRQNQKRKPSTTSNPYGE